MLGPRKTILVSGHALAPKGTVLHEINKLVTVTLVLDWESGEILDADSTFVTDLSKNYLRNLLVGKKLLTDHDEIRNTVENHFLVDSQKSLLKAISVASEKYKFAQQNN